MEPLDRQGDVVAGDRWTIYWAGDPRPGVGGLRPALVKGPCNVHKGEEVEVVPAVEADRLRAENDHLRQFEDRGDWCIYRDEYETLKRTETELVRVRQAITDFLDGVIDEKELRYA